MDPASLGSELVSYSIEGGSGLCRVVLVAIGCPFFFIIFNNDIFLPSFLLSFSFLEDLSFLLELHLSFIQAVVVFLWMSLIQLYPLGIKERMRGSLEKSGGCQSPLILYVDGCGLHIQDPW